MTAAAVQLCKRGPLRCSSLAQPHCRHPACLHRPRRRRELRRDVAKTLNLDQDTGASPHLHPTFHPGGGIADPVCTTARLPLAVPSPICCIPHPFIPVGTACGPQARAHMCALHPCLTAASPHVSGQGGRVLGFQVTKFSAISTRFVRQFRCHPMLESQPASGRVPTCSRRSPDAPPRVLEKNGVPFCIVSWGQGAGGI